MADPASLLPESNSSKGGGKFQDYREILSHYTPILHWLPEYDYKKLLQKDVACGITLGFVLIGQSLAHANLCGVPVIHGPHSCIIPPLVYAIFGTCNQGSVGTGGLLALLTGIQLQAYDDIDERVRAGAVLGLMVGGIMFLMGVFQLSFLVRFLSRPALSGFITGSALLIMKAMVMPMLGMSQEFEKKGIIENILNPGNFANVNPYTVGVSFVSLMFLHYIHLISKRLKEFKELIVLGASAIFCQFVGQYHGMVIIGTVPSGLPKFIVPEVDAGLLRELFPGAVLIAVVCFISSFASAKKCAMKGHYRVDAFNELVGLGLSNVSSGCFGGVPVQIGLSRSALCFAMGANTQFGSNIIVALSVTGIVFAFSQYLYFVPKCVLDAIIVNAAIGLFEFHEAHAFYKSNDKVAPLVWMIAFLATVFTGAFDGILIAVVMSLLLVLHHIVNPSIHVLGQAEGEESGAKIWVNMQAAGNDSAKKIPHVLVVRVAGPIFYANSERFQDYVHDLEVHEANDGNPISAIVLCATSVPFVDVTAMQIIEEMFESCEARNVKLYIAGAFGKTRRDLEKALADKLHQSELRGKSIEDCVQHALKDLGEWDKSAVDAAPVQAVADPFHHRALPQIQKTSASRLESGTIAKAATADLAVSGNKRDLARDKFFTDDYLYSGSGNDISKVLSTKTWAVRKPKPGSNLHTLYTPHEDEDASP